MIVTLDAQTRIRGTERCWQLEKPRKRGKSIRWEPFGYYSTFAQALVAAGQREIRISPVEDLSLAISEVHRIAAKYGQLFDDAIRKVTDENRDRRVAKPIAA